MPRERKRQGQAKTVMAAYNESEAKSRKESTAAIKMVKGSARMENTISEQLKKVPETPEEKVRRHQDNPCDGKELTQRIRLLYENGGEKRPSRTKYLTGEIERGNNSRRCDLNSLIQRIIIQPFTVIHNNTISVVLNTPQPHDLPFNTSPFRRSPSSIQYHPIILREVCTSTLHISTTHQHIEHNITY